MCRVDPLQKKNYYKKDVVGTDLYVSSVLFIGDPISRSLVTQGGNYCW